MANQRASKSKLQTCVIGGGWAGLAAAVQAVQQGHRVTLLEMAPQLGGRARAVPHQELLLDNGQHILIGAYTQTSALMRLVGVRLDHALMRKPLQVVYPDGKGLRLMPGQALLAFGRAVAGYSGWSWGSKLALLSTATGWALRRFRCDPKLTVGQLTRHLPRCVREDLLDPLCVAALNTPAPLASAQVFLRVLQDALLSGPGSSDLLLPRWRLSQLWPEPAARWLEEHRGKIVCGQRVQTLVPQEGGGWLVDGVGFDRVVLACSANEAARLVQPHAPPWAAQAQALRYEPITTVYAHSPNTQLRAPMLALRANAHAPAQFVFDLGVISGMEGVLAFVVSGAGAWVERGHEAIVKAVLQQGARALAGHLRSPLEALQVITEKRATFLCTPDLQRPSLQVLPHLVAAGDYIDGPYPSTLEGAMRSGVAAALAL
jgi:hydroxysqualene dehydroxylase